MLQLSDYRSAFAMFAMEELFADVDFEDVSLDKTTGDLYFESACFGIKGLDVSYNEKSYKDGSKALTGFDDDLSPRIVSLTDAPPDIRGSGVYGQLLYG
ncbi:MAG: hypothetical protein SVR04_03200 [Spirochaetota bacterium]|nr:hypothetical protein [Spirochaetota bacterium]